MESFDEQLTRVFLDWEMLGRGALPVCELPVYPEPPFRPFTGYRFPRKQIVDDGRRHTAISAFLESAREPAPQVAKEEEEAPELQFDFLERSPIVEIQLTLPADFSAPNQVFANFLLSLDRCEEPIAMEFLGTGDRISFQFAAGEPDADLLRSQLEAFFPEAVINLESGSLQEAWTNAGPTETAIFECGLADLFFLPLATSRVDPFIGFAAALSELHHHELGLIQVIFHPARYPWQESMKASLINEEGHQVFNNAPELYQAAQDKTSKPLFGTLLRLAVRADDYHRLTEVFRQLASPLRVFSNPKGNELAPLPNDDYALDAHVEDLLLRRSRRFGMLLNLDELIGFVHLPSEQVRSLKFERITGTTKAAPPSALLGPGLILGENTHRGQTGTVHLSAENRVRHMHVVGVPGSGKSTFLLNLIRQDMEAGQGLAVIDPHGDLIDAVLRSIPEDRMDDVVLLDSSDETASVAFNLLSAHSDIERTQLASDLVSVFQRLSTSWGDQMSVVLRNAILAFLESSEGGTLADLRRFLLDDKFRKQFLKTVQDPEVVYYWEVGFPNLKGDRSMGPVLTRLETFLSPKPIRYIVSQKRNTLDFSSIMDEGKIFLARLSQAFGRENSYLMGSLLVAKFQQTIMARQAQEVSARRDFWFYIDEFHSFMTPSMAEILTGARKYRLGMILAHQDLGQLKRDPEVASAVLSIGGVRTVFRVGDADAKALESGFEAFTASDLQSLETGEAVCRIERKNHDFNIAVSLPSDPPDGEERRQRAIEYSRQKYAIPREQIEAELREGLSPPNDKSPSPSSAVANTEPTPSDPEPASAKDAKPAPASAAASPTTKDKKAEPAPQTSSPGRGGSQHKEIQNRIKKAAQALNFKATIEKKIHEGKGIDVLLERDDATIAVEICVSTTTSHELDNNIQKCLDAGYASIFLLSPEESRINTINKALRQGFPPEATVKIRCMTPDEFVAYLDTLAPLPRSGNTPPPLPNAKSRIGYGIKRKFTQVDTGEAQDREKEVLQIIEKAIRTPAQDV